MTGWHTRWLIVPGVVGLIVLLGLAVSAEPRPEPQPERVSDTSIPDASPPRGSQDDQDGPANQSGDSTSQSQPSEPNGISEGDGQQTQQGESDQRGDSDSAGGGETVSFDIRSDQGSVGIRIDETHLTALPRAKPTGNEVPEVTTQPLLPDVIDGQVGYRLNESGQLDPVTVDQIQPGDLVIQPVDDGIDVVNAQGGHSEIRPVDDDPGPDGAGGDFTVTEVGVGGDSTTLEPDVNGVVHLDDGVTVQLPSPQPALTLWERATTTQWKWIVLGFLALALASIGVALYLHLNRPRHDTHFVAQGSVPVNQFNAFLTMLADDPDPARSIRLAFGAAEQGMGSLQARRETETPFEWYARATTDHSELDRPLSTLCSQFATARFAPHRPTPADRDLVIDELRLLAQLAGYSHDHTQRHTQRPAIEPRVGAP